MSQRTRHAIDEGALTVTAPDKGVPQKSVASTMSPRRRKRSWSFMTTKKQMQVMLLMTTFILCLKYFGVISTLSVYQGITLLPIFVTAVSALVSPSTTQVSDRLLSMTLAASVVCAQLPLYIATSVACIAMVAFGLATQPREERLHRVSPTTTPLQIVASTVLLLVVLLTENFMVWVVAATFLPGRTGNRSPRALQDNGRIFLNSLFLKHGLTRAHVVMGLRRLWNVQWSLVSCVGTCFALLDIYLHPRRQLYSVALRAVLTLSASRVIRTISFLLTVIPSQVPNCYAQRFPPPPESTFEWILVGFLPAAHGGCNDLIVSGHATVVTTLACIVTSISNDRVFQMSVWTLLVFDFAIEVYEGYHYSVDMWFGMIIVALIWRALDFVELNNRSNYDSRSAATNRTADEATNQSFIDSTFTARNVTENKTTFHLVSTRDILVYSLPAFIGYVQAVGILPESTANAVIVLFVASSACIFAVSRYVVPEHSDSLSHLALHVLLCVIFVALVTYL